MTPEPGAPDRVAQAGTERPVLVHVMTVPLSLFFLKGQAAFMRQACGLETHAVAAPGGNLATFAELEKVPVHGVEMERRITPLRDARAVWRLRRMLRALRPAIVHAHTPKGGLLGMIAACLAGSPVRIYHLRGLPLVTATGWRRLLYRCTEWTACRLAHRVIAVSHSLRRVAIEERLCDPAKITVLLGGSGNGVDVNRFRPVSPEARRAARAVLGVSDDVPLVGFLGRLSREKGIGDLAAAWRAVREAEPRAQLLLAGEEDGSDPPAPSVLTELRADPRVRFLGLVLQAERLYAALDVVVLPSWREGFPNVALEAAASGVPVVSTRVLGCTDAVQDGVTGTLVPAHDPAALGGALLRYLADPAIRAAHGEAARRRAVAEFRRESIWEALAAEYRDLLAAAAARRLPQDVPA